MSAPLAGMRVLDLSRGVAGPHATKLLAGYGATVLKIEPPGGDPARSAGPFRGDLPNPETSATFLWLNGGKRSAILDLNAPPDAAIARELAGQSDLVMEDFDVSERSADPLRLESLRRGRPDLVICSITPFGLDGPYAELRASDLVLQAMGGAMYATGHTEREPLRLGGQFAEWHAGLAAAVAAMFAVLRAEATGLGEHIDLSIYETLAAGKDRRQLNLLAHAYSGFIGVRRAGGFAVTSGVRPCSDGFINLLGHMNLGSLLRMIGRPDLAERPEIATPHLAPAELVEEIESEYLQWTLSHTMAEALEISQAHRILGGTVRTVADALEDPVFAERGVWDEFDHPDAGRIRHPGRPFIMSGWQRPAPERPPLLGEHEAAWPVNSAEREGQGPRDAQAAERGATDATGHRPLPLEGIRVLDLAVVWAGPFASQILGEWGAEVLKMEPISTVQPQTRALNSTGRPGWFVDADPGDEPWNRGVSFNSSGCNKRSFTGNVRTPEGMAAFRRLIEMSDIVVENNVPETIDKLGIGYETLRAINPRIIMVRMPGFGLTGAYANYRSWGNHLEAMAGHLLARCYPDATPDAVGESYACDSVAGLVAAFATAVALRQREHTGEGQLIEVPQLEAFAGMMGRDMIDYCMNERLPEARANEHDAHAPHNAYPCAGSDRWIAIDIATDSEFVALCGVLNAAHLAEDERFRTAADRLEHRAALDEAVSTCTGGRDRDELFKDLQAAGVTAGPVQDEADAFACPQLRARGFFQRLERDDIGGYDYPGLLFRWRDTPNGQRRAPPRLGEANEYVYRELLGYDDETFGALVESGEVGTAYPPALRRPG